MFDFFTELWKKLNSPDNDPIIIGAIAVIIALLISNVRSYFSFKKLIDDKDTRIKDLVEQRNKFQDIVLKELGSRRKTSKNEN